MNKLQISFIGSGRVATHLAQAFFAYGMTIRQIFSRQLLHAQALADTVQAQAIDHLLQLQQVDILLIAVSDTQIAAVAEQLKQIHYPALVVHTSGSTDMAVLTQTGLRAGVFYPLQTFSFGQKIDWHHTPILLESALVQDFTVLQQLATQLSLRVYAYDSAQRLSLHLAAVFACNFSNYCYDVAQQILAERQVDDTLLLPLIQATAAKLQQQSAFTNQTGPAVRGDHAILTMHQQLLTQHPEWQQIYQLFSQAIMRRHGLE